MTPLNDRFWGSLPYKADSIVEIGPGDGVLAAQLASKHQYHNAVIHLIDGDGTVTPQVGYQDITKPWNDVGKAMEHVLQEVPLARVITYQANTELTIPCDLVISIQSWGYHYSIDVYLPMVLRSLRKGGIVILDHRQTKSLVDGNEGAMVKAGFAKLCLIEARPKWHRVAWVR